MAFHNSLTSWQADRPAEPLLGLSHEMSRMIDTFFAGANNLMNLGSPSALVSPVRLDVVEAPNEVSLTAEMPGMHAQDIEVRIDGNTLYLSGHKRCTVDDQCDQVHIMERSYGHFLRAVPLPFLADPSTVTADFECGVLTVRIPKREEAEEAQQIQVRERSARAEVPQPSLGPSADGMRPGVARHDADSQAADRTADDDTASPTPY